jgi:GMP synthase-like glutamine amidotransferase
MATLARGMSQQAARPSPGTQARSPTCPRGTDRVCQLIARRVRECHVYPEIVPSTMPVSEMLAKNPKTIIP